LSLNTSNVSIAVMDYLRTPRILATGSVTGRRRRKDRSENGGKREEEKEKEEKEEEDMSNYLLFFDLYHSIF